MTEDHYFTAAPASADERRDVPVVLAGRDVTVQTARGVFQPDQIDRGTAVLLAHATPPPPDGDLLDLGCGWGPIALTLALRSPDATVWAVDVNERALDLTRTNAERLGVGAAVRAVPPDEVPDDVRLAAIWSNPPIRVGKEALHALLLRWVPRLAPGGVAQLVVAKQLGADSLQTWLARELDALSPGTFTVRRTATAKGFRVIEVVRAG
ncbi:methyltransferase [Arsenicicoccus piscis]|uniref:16S RNA G1207 methylase RsmC n=1 Tax=Arsenicicoccus piscis TaxID=673954 RepID=A0ABQ6HNY6_9MICO|nr:methyltransferase [Arsenicicoccus piscis]MCH8628829.1 methyltransferase [Arsenicicoccus piscis]GMA20121.1 16S RNA G1207 methylase RsmC [Arsenicicoccus piscis]